MVQFTGVQVGKAYRLLVVDDEERILDFLKSKLKTSGYEVITARDGVEALQQVQANEPDLMLLDIIIPRLNGFEVLKRLRHFSSVPVIVLSAIGSDAEKVRALGLGADDYQVKPFNPDELVARIEAVRRRLEPPNRRINPESLTVDELTIDFNNRRVMIDGQQKYLTKIEWLLLSELARNAGRLTVYEDLLTRVWGQEYRDDVPLLATWISRLRRKVEKEPGHPQLIRTISKTGYIMGQSSADVDSEATLEFQFSTL